MIRISIVARHLPVRIGLREMLSKVDGLEVIAEAASLDTDSGVLEETDVLLLAAPFDGAQITGVPDDLREIRDSATNPAILLLTDEAGDALSLAGTAHAWGILPMSASEDELEAAIQALAEGLVVGAPALLKEAWRRPAVVPLNVPEAVEQLTAREAEVLGLMARGLANKQIAVQLGISEHTVKFHLSSIYAKLGANSRTEALTIGTRLGLIVL